MLKKAIIRGLLGFPLGIAMGYIITILISLVAGDGNYYPVAPELIDVFRNEINAVVFQTVLCGILGVSFSASSIIWEMEHWSIAKQTGIHLMITSCVMLPIAYFAHWVERTLLGFMLYYAVFLVVFFIIWLIQYVIWKNKIRDINRKVRETS